MKYIYKTLILIIVILLSFVLFGCDKTNDNDDKITIISTSFPGYDFARAITKESNVEVIMLLNPGSELHDYEPTPKDIINIQKSDMFIYVGGESDSWVDSFTDSLKNTKLVRLIDFVNLVLEEKKEGMEFDEDEDYDEHVWTSPTNAILIIESLKQKIIEIDPANKDLYELNTNNYINELKEIDEEIEDVVYNSKRKEIIFADRYPIRYFSDRYGLTYYAAFPGCSEQTEASAKTISFLIDKVKEDNIPAVFHIELSSGNIAKAISEQTGAKVLEFNSAHNISKEDFDLGITYVDLMKRNIIVLKEALN